MKLNTSTLWFACLMVIAGCASPHRSQPAASLKSPGIAATQPQRLFLHLLAPPAYTTPPIPAGRILTARIRPSEYFAIAAGAPGNPFTNGWAGAMTLAQWNKAGVPEQRPLEPFWNSGEAVLAGRIDVVDGKFFAQLQGRNQTTLNYFHGEMELEKPVYAQGCLIRDSVWNVWFVLSESPDCRSILRALDERTLQAPLVPLDSPAAKQWAQQQGPRGSLQILNTEPVAPSKAAPPHP